MTAKYGCTVLLESSSTPLQRFRVAKRASGSSSAPWEAGHRVSNDCLSGGSVHVTYESGMCDTLLYILAVTNEHGLITW